MCEHAHACLAAHTDLLLCTRFPRHLSAALVHPNPSTKKQQEIIQDWMDDIIYRIEEWDEARQSGYDAGHLSVWLNPSWWCEDCGEDHTYMYLYIM
eukprot:COSAG01_NODE_503_length_16167_cov_10.407230_25_plen_96_part_00